MDLKEEIIQLREHRYSYIGKILNNLSEEELNLQPIRNKRSIAEVIAHIFMIDGVPFFIAKTIQRFFLRKTVNASQSRNLDGSDYEWDLEKGQVRKPKTYVKSALLKNFEKNKSRITKLNFKPSDTKYIYFSEYHANFHLKQLRLLIDMAGITINSE